MKIFFTYFAILMIMFSSWIHDAAAQQVPTVTPVSDRTPQVRDAIVAAAGVPANQVTEAHLAAITSLDLGLKKITSLKAGDFDGLNNLTVLYLPNNKLSTLPSGIFDNLTQLTRLLLGNNELSTLPSDIFNNLTQLTRLDLWSNEFSTLPSGIFNNLTQLTDLSLRYNQLSTLPSGIFDDLTQLTWLWLGENELSTLPSDIFDNLTQLIWLYLPENELSTLPSGIFDNLTQLKALLLGRNQLSTLSSDIFDNLTQLGAVHLDNNELSTLPSDIFDNLTQLESLLLNENQLSTLPSGIFAGLTKLTILRLQGNAVDPLPLPVSLEAVGNGAFKAVASTGAPFDIVLPLVVANGSLTTGATTITIDTGQVESDVLTVNRTPGTSGAVTVNIGVLPGIPTDVDNRYNLLNHQGYALVKSGTLPLVVISGIADPPPPTDDPPTDDPPPPVDDPPPPVDDPPPPTDDPPPPVDDPPPPANNPPVFTEGASTTRTIAENTVAGTNIGSAVSATDADDDTLTYTLSGTDAAAFSIVSTTGQLRTLAALDYETKSIYTVSITASDGSLTDTISVTINVTDIDDPPPPVDDPPPPVDDPPPPTNNPPVFSEGASTTRTVAENTVAGANIGSAVSATDADDDTLTYTLSGTGAAAFSIVSTTGQLRTLAALDYETKSIYTVSITASDGSLTDTISVTINVTDIAEGPVFSEGASTTRTVAENTVAGTNIGSAVSATDADDDTLTYTLSGTDAAAFSIVSTTGQLRTQAALNAAIKSVYSITVVVSDGVHTVTISIIINVTDAEMPPVLDVNSDGVVDLFDLLLVATNFGATVDPTTPNPADVNDDGVVNLTDLLLVIGGMESTAGVAAAPVLSEANLHHWIAEAKRQALGDATFAKGVAVLEQLLGAVRPTPKKTLLLSNYPNPFNPETWIPYHLATDAEVVLTIYNVRGVAVRTLTLGHQPAGVYESRRRAAYWDGRNAVGEPVASGLYFYTLTAGDFTATRKMLIAK